MLLLLTTIIKHRCSKRSFDFFYHNCLWDSPYCYIVLKLMISIIKILQLWCRMHSWSKWENSLGDMALRRQDFRQSISHSPLCQGLAGDLIMRDSASATKQHCFGSRQCATSPTFCWQWSSSKRQLSQNADKAKKSVQLCETKQEQLLISDDEINLMGNTSNF